ncbi:MAG: PucR family transcriptional regulator [Lachnospiraceae bacterium]
MTTNLEWLLYNSSLKDLSLLTNTDCLNNAISSVNIMDDPEVVHWVKPGELVLTTGYIFVNNPELQTTILQDLKIAGCPALCIKTKRYFDTIPEDLLAFSEKIKLPIIELPAKYTFADVTKLINNQLYQEKFQDMLNEQTLYNQLFNAYFEKKNTDEILDILSSFLSKSLFILTANYHCEWHSILPTDSQYLNFVTELTNSSSIFSAVTLPALNGNATSITIIYKEEEITIFLIPIPVYQRYLCIFTQDSTLLPIDILTHALKIISFSQNNQLKTSGNYNHYYDSFFHFLNNDEKKNDLEHAMLFDYYGFPYKKERICMLLSPKNKDITQITQPIIKTITNCLQLFSPKHDSFFIAYNNQCICIYLFDEKGDMKKNVSRIATLIDEKVNSTFIIGISQKSVDSSDIALSYKEASFMVSLFPKLKTKTIISFKDHLIFWIVNFIPDIELEKYFTETVKPLYEYDLKNKSELLPTLLSYFEHSYNSSLTSQALYIHRNTFIKRMNKISELIEFDLKNSSLLFSIQVGICVYILKYS